MVRVIDHAIRKNKVLAATVDAYIRSGEPVSSQDLAQLFNVSSATIRNILAELEAEGFLFSPHISAGRMPTTAGYRYYVDFLMEGNELLQEQKADIVGQFKRGGFSLEEVLEKASELIASVTHYASIVYFSDDEGRIFYKGLSNIIQQPEFHDLEKLSLLVELLEEKQRLLEIINKELNAPLKVYIGEELGCPPISDVCSLVVSTYRRGNKEQGRLAVLGPRRMSYGRIVCTLEFVSSTLNSVLEDF